MELKSGYKQTEIGVIPEDWGYGSLGQFWTVTDCKHITAKFIPNGIPVASIKEVQSKFVDLTNAKQTTESYYQQLIEGGRKPVAGDLIISRNATVGEIAQVADWHSKFAMGQDVCLLRKKSAEYSTEYLQAVFKSPIIGNQLSDLMVGSTFKRINVEQIRNFAISFPLKKEQDAIATMLSDVDALLAKLDALIAKKRDLKQAAMQQLLTAQTRLPGFSGEWEVKRIDEIATIGRGRVISHKEITASRMPQYPVYSSQTSNHGIMGYIDTNDFEGEYITWTTDGEKAGTAFYRNGKFNCTNVCGTLKLHSDDAIFVAYILKQQMPKYVSRNLANPKLMNDVVKKIFITIPSTIKEQTAIANVLSDMDAEITALEARRNKTRTLKQGMMQELLTGRIRLFKGNV